jgi:hypothetical protein
MQTLWEKKKGGSLVYWAGMLIVLGSFLYPVLQSITRAPIKSDATLNVYIAQQLAAGKAPYSDYFIMHPPISHFVGALAVLVSKWFSVQAVIGTRLLALFLSLAILGVTWLMAREFVRGGELLAVWALSSNVLMLMVIWGFYEKLVMVLFLYLGLYLLQKGRVFASGIFLGLVLMTWGASIILLPVFLIILILRPEISWKRFFLAVVLVFALVFGVLALSGSLLHFFQQYFVTVLEYALNKLISSGVRDAEFGLSNITANTNLSAIDVVAVLGGGVSFLAFLISKKRTEWSAKPVIGILLITLICGFFILIDYQSPFDLIILLPALSILFAWGVFRLIGYWVKIWHVAYQPTYLLVILLVFSVVRAYSFQRAPNRLYAQREAAVRLQPLIAENEVLFLGDLSPLVLAEGTNPLPAIHMGPKSFLAMRNQGYTLLDILAELDAHPPALILADQRNMEYPHLALFYLWLEDHYILVGDTTDPTLHVYLYRQAEDAILPALAFLFAHNPGSYAAGELELAESQNISENFIPVSEQISLIGYQMADDVRLYWWTLPPVSIKGSIVYRYVTETGQELTEWTAAAQRWQAGEITITEMPPADLPERASGLEFCLMMGEDLLDTCQGSQVFSLQFSEERR